MLGINDRKAIHQQQVNTCYTHKRNACPHTCTVLDNSARRASSIATSRPDTTAGASLMDTYFLSVVALVGVLYPMSLRHFPSVISVCRNVPWLSFMSWLVNGYGSNRSRVERAKTRHPFLNCPLSQNAVGHHE